MKILLEKEKGPAFQEQKGNVPLYTYSRDHLKLKYPLFVVEVQHT